MRVRPDDIIVTISHPFGEVHVTLSEWIRRGPGPRPLVRPVAARSALSGEELPLTVIPLQYRNDERSRAMIERGEIANPWPP